MPRLFVEAKGLGENINDPKWANQTISYAAVAGVERVSLTDGNEWRIYNAHAPVPVERKLFRIVRLDEDVGAAAETLDLLSKTNMEENRIEVLWKSQFVDRQVHAELEALFGGDEPAPELVTLLRKRLNALAPKDIRASLGRLRAKFDFPSVAPTPTPTPASVKVTAAQPTPPTSAVVAPATSNPTAQAGGSKAGKRQKRTRTPEETKTKLVDLLADGYLAAPLALTGTYEGQTFTATADANGVVTFDGQTFSTLSGAGRAVRLKVKGPTAPASVLATDGRDFWKAADASGVLVKLDELRRRYVENR